MTQKSDHRPNVQSHRETDWAPSARIMNRRAFHLRRELQEFRREGTPLVGARAPSPRGPTKSEDCEPLYCSKTDVTWGWWLSGSAKYSTHQNLRVRRRAR